jgi:hypothetical protein
MSLKQLLLIVAGVSLVCFSVRCGYMSFQLINSRASAEYVGYWLGSIIVGAAGGTLLIHLSDTGTRGENDATT